MDNALSLLIIRIIRDNLFLLGLKIEWFEILWILPAFSNQKEARNVIFL